MSVYSKFLHLQSGVARTVDLSNASNALGIADLELLGSTSGTLSQFASATTSTYSIIWPDAQGSASTFLQNDGSGNLSWVSVTSSPAISNSFVAGQTFAANTSYVVRWGMDALSETTNRIYAADYDTTSFDEFWAIGIAFSASGVTAGQNINVVSFGSYTLGSADTPFLTANIGDPVWLTTAGGFSATAPSGATQADLKVGVIMTTTSIWLDGQVTGIGSAGSGVPTFPLTVDGGGTGVASFTPYAILAGGTTSTDPLQQVSGLGTSGYVLTSNGASALPTWQPGGTSLTFADSLVNNSGTVTLVNDSATPGNTKYYGTDSGGTLGYYSIPSTGVTSVALADGSSTPIYSISGSPVTSTGTLTFTLSTQSANTIFAGPTTGSAAQPGFRSLVAADLPTISLTSDVTGSGSGGSIATTVAKIAGTVVSGTTGSTNVVFSASPTLTGTITAAAANFSGAISASNFSGSSSGTNTGDQTITLTSDVTGSGTGSFATTIASNVVTNAKLAQMGGNTIKGNNTGSTANAADLSTSQVLTMLGIFAGKAAITNGTSTVSVTFSTAFGSTNYAITCNLINTVDTNPVFESPTITSQSTTGFTIKLNGPVPTANYSLSWTAIANN